MKSKFIVIGIVIVAILIIVGMCVSSYNSMVSKDEAVSSQWGNVQNAYQRRSELIPNLVGTVKGYAAHEQQTLTQVIEARAKATQINLSADQLTEENLQKYQQAQGQLSQALGRLMLVKEQYPELKANQNFMALQDELTGTENRISTERNKFNEMARDYNAYIRSFPKNIIASMSGFDKKAYFQADQAAQSAPKVEF